MLNLIIDITGFPCTYVESLRHCGFTTSLCSWGFVHTICEWWTSILCVSLLHIGMRPCPIGLHFQYTSSRIKLRISRWWQQADKSGALLSMVPSVQGKWWWKPVCKVQMLIGWQETSVHIPPQRIISTVPPDSLTKHKFTDKIIKNAMTTPEH